MQGDHQMARMSELSGTSQSIDIEPSETFQPPATMALDSIPEAYTTLHGDAPCAECGTTENLVWFTDSVFWNNVVRFGDAGEHGYSYALDRWGGEPILCLPCFVKVAEERGFRPTGWRVSPEWPVRRIEPEPIRPRVRTHLFERENTPLCQAAGLSSQVEVWGEISVFDEAEVDCVKCVAELRRRRRAAIFHPDEGGRR